jgi:hypothetical protein
LHGWQGLTNDLIIGISNLCFASIARKTFINGSANGLSSMNAAERFTPRESSSAVNSREVLPQVTFALAGASFTMRVKRLSSSLNGRNGAMRRVPPGGLGSSK